MAIIHIEDLSYTYPAAHSPALQHINLRVEAVSYTHLTLPTIYSV